MRTFTREEYDFWKKPHGDFTNAAEMRAIYRKLWPYKLPSNIDPRLRFLKQNISRANGRNGGWKVDIDEFDAWVQGVKQNWLCAETRKPLEFTRGGSEYKGTWSNPMSCTIDRIDAECHYTPDNIQLVTWEFNRFKSDYSETELVEMATHILRRRNLLENRVATV